MFRKMEMPETDNHPLCGCALVVIQKNHLSMYNKVVQAILQKGKVTKWRKQIQQHTQNGCVSIISFYHCQQI